MPAETLRHRSAVGRFPSVTLEFGEDKEVPEETNVETENACGRWLRKVCPCCRRKHDDEIMDALVTETDDEDKEETPADEKPETDACKLDG